MKPDFSSKRMFLIPIFCLLFLVILVIVLSFLGKKIPEPTELISNDGSFKLVVPGKVKIERSNSNTLDFYSSEDEMIVTSNVISKQREVVLSDIVSSEMADLPNNRNRLENVSDLIKLELNGCEAYKYSYTYFDEAYNNSFYTEVVWISTDRNIYALDFQVIIDNQEKYKPIFTEIISSFEEINEENSSTPAA